MKRFSRQLVAVALMGALAAIAAPAGATQAAEATVKASDVTTVNPAPVRISVSEYAAAVGRELTAKEAKALDVGTTACWTWTPYLQYSPAGVLMWKYLHRVDWCQDGTKITSTSLFRAWGETYSPGWNWQGVQSTWGSGGVGYTAWVKGSQGKFCLVQYYQCIQESWPWIETRVNGNGTWSWTSGGV